MLALALLACAAPEPDSTPAEPTPNPTADAAWDALEADVDALLEADAVPGMQVAVVVDGALRYTGAWGQRGYDDDAPVTDATLFRWASVSKMHTATAVLRLVDEGLVDLDAPVTDYVDAGLEAGFDPATITTRHLLTHTAALPDELSWACDTDDAALGRSVRRSSPPLYAPPGSFYNYSNTGFVWAGALLEQVAGEPFPALMERLVLDPAGMESATFLGAAAADAEHATGAGWWDGDLWTYELADYDCAPSRPAGWLHGTATDLARTAEWQLADDGLLAPDTLAAMHAQVDTHYRPDGGYQVGMGQFTFPYGDVDVVFHDGWVSGFVSAWAIVPERGFGVAVVANADWADPYAVMYGAIDRFLAPEGVRWPEPVSDPTTWPAYTGIYYDNYVYGAIQVYVSGDQLRANFFDLDYDMRLDQVAGDYFTGSLDGEGVDVRFIPDDTGTVRWFVTRGGVGTRIDDPGARPPDTVDAEPIAPDKGRAALARYARPPGPGRLPLGLVGVPSASRLAGPSARDGVPKASR